MDTEQQLREPLLGRGVLPILLVLGASFLVLVGHVKLYYPFLSDDTLISLRYSQRMLHGHGLTWNDGEAVEGYSNLLWVLLSAAMGAMGFDLIEGVRLLGFLCFGVIPLLIVWSMKPKTLPQWYGTGLVCLILPVCGPVAVWTIGGLEQPLLALVLAGAVASALNLVGDKPVTRITPYIVTGIWCGLAALTRPDAPLFAGIIGVTVLLWHRDRAVVPGVCWFGFCTGGPVIGQLIFRLAYYGTLVPNTALVKVSFSLNYLSLGLRYLRFGYGSLYPLLPVVIVTLVGAYSNKDVRGRIVLLALLIFFWSFYLLTIGGDVHPASRHFIPILVLLTFFAAEYGKTRTRIDLLVLTPTIVFLFLFQVASANNRWAALPKEQKLTWDGQSVGLFLKEAFGELQPLIAVDAAGATPYFSELPSLDMLGLNDGYLTRHPPADLGNGWIGHEIGDFRYVSQRSPHFIFFCGALGNEMPCFASGRNFVADESFHGRYFLMKFRTSTPEKLDAKAWVRRDFGLVGGENRIGVPGYGFTGADAFVRIGASQKAVLSIGSSASETVGSVRVSSEVLLPAGTWRAVPVGQGVANAAIQLTPRGAQKNEMIASTITVTSETPITIDLTVPWDGATKELYEVILDRLDKRPG
jgi:arabinofuranosyltransferase